MRIYTKNNDCLITTDDKTFSINGDEFAVGNSSEVKELISISIELLKNYFSEEMFLATKPLYFSQADTVVLLALGQYVKSLHCTTENRSYDIVFSYNFPLAFENYLAPHIITLFDKVVSAQLIALGISSEFVVVDTSKAEEYTLFYEKFGDLLRRNDQAIIVKSCQLCEALMTWRDYCLERFDQLYSMDAVDVYSKIYALSGFESLSYLLNGQVLARGVRFKSEHSKTIYYCIFAWDKKFKSISPGIYAYAKTIALCHDIGFKFSFCYGLQDYKLRLIEFFTSEQTL